jgi:radical SAM superfamily enzyme YgiQ (UPF0313 family)
MVFERVLLIQPSYPGSITPQPGLHPGLGYISEYLNKERIENIVVDKQLGYTFEDLGEKINAFCPDLIGFTMMSINYRNTYSLITNVKQKFPAIPIAVGGPHISTMREEALMECPSIDFGIVFEGEITLFELCYGRKAMEIDGLIYRDAQARPKYTGNRDFIKNLDEIPFPTYRSFEMDKYDAWHPLVTSRGCPYECTYCPVSTVIGKQFRTRSPENLVDEIEYWFNRGKRTFTIRDDNFSLLQNRVYEICNTIERRRLKDLCFALDNGIRADRCSKDLLSRMRGVGFRYIAFGVEAGNNKVLGQIKKHEKIADIERAIRNACELGYTVKLFFLVGSPGETWQDIEDSIKIATKYPINEASFYNIVPFPGTELYEWIESNGYFLERAEDYLNWPAPAWVSKPIFYTPELSANDRRKAFKYTNIFVKRQIQKNYYLYRYGILGWVYASLIQNNFLQKTFLNKLSKDKFSPILRSIRDKAVLFIKRMRQQRSLM